MTQNKFTKNIDLFTALGIAAAVECLVCVGNLSAQPAPVSYFQVQSCIHARQSFGRLKPADCEVQKGKEIFESFGLGTSVSAAEISVRASESGRTIEIEANYDGKNGQVLSIDFYWATTAYHFHHPEIFRFETFRDVQLETESPEGIVYRDGQSTYRLVDPNGYYVDRWWNFNSSNPDQPDFSEFKAGPLSGTQEEPALETYSFDSTDVRTRIGTTNFEPNDGTTIFLEDGSIFRFRKAAMEKETFLSSCSLRACMHSSIPWATVRTTAYSPQSTTAPLML